MIPEQHQYHALSLCLSRISKRTRKHPYLTWNSQTFSFPMKSIARHYSLIFRLQYRVRLRTLTKMSIGFLALMRRLTRFRRNRNRNRHNDTEREEMRALDSAVNRIVNRAMANHRRAQSITMRPPLVYNFRFKAKAGDGRKHSSTTRMSMGTDVADGNSSNSSSPPALHASPPRTAAATIGEQTKGRIATYFAQTKRRMQCATWRWGFRQ